MASAPPPTVAVLEKKSRSSASVDNEKQTPPDGTEALVVDSPDDSESSRRPSLVRVVSLVALALILGWWISSITIQTTRHRWIVQTISHGPSSLSSPSALSPTPSSPAPSRPCGSSSYRSPASASQNTSASPWDDSPSSRSSSGSAFGFKLENVRHRRALFSYPTC